ncbi:cytochrome P450 2U1-like [Patiria miniata]|uniref:Cytochrome P450 n=1 Tax=Patiria miniata TaxID=46514 RepID=A0A913Z3Y5_PATMI|nr:cytochrome P450 2U1-like [Patiria miniata]
MIVAQLMSVVSSLNVQTVVLFVVVLLLTIAWIRHRQRPQNLPPGPLAWPVIGNAGELLRGRQLHHVLDGWARQYGSVVKVWLGPRLTIVLSSFEVVKEALIKQADCFSDRMVQAESKHTRGSIVMSNGDNWKERRRFGLSAMRTLGMGKRSVEHKITEEARHLLECFDGEGEKPFDPEHAILNAVSNIICLISFGYRFEYTDPKFAYLIKSVKTTLVAASFANFGLFSFFRRTATDTRDRIESVKTFIQEVVKDHQESFDANDIRDIIDMYMVEIEQQEKSGKDVAEDSAFCKTTMWKGIYDLFVAGTDTTTNTLMWLMLYIAMNQDVQEKVQKEIDDVIGGDRQPTIEDRANMPYTNAVLWEILRIRPVTPFGVPHRTHYETEFLGYTIPANTMVFVNHWTIFHDPKSWKDPEKFDPTRFLSKDGKTVEKPEVFMPFSLGRRVCMGETLAKMELFLFFVNLLQRFTYSLPANKPRPSLEGIVGVTLGPTPFEVVAKRR